MRVTLLTILALLLVGITSCKKHTFVANTDLNLSRDSFALHLEKQFDKWTILMCQDQLPYMDTLHTFYADRNYEPIWWDAILGDSVAWEHLRKTTAHSVYHGLDSLNYALGLVDYHRGKIPQFGDADSAYRWMAELELIISNHMLRLYSDIANGRTSPKKVYGYTYMLPRNNWKAMDYYEYLEEDNKIAYLDAIHKRDTTYQELQKVMKYYLEKKKAAKSSSIDFSDYPKLEKGDSGAIITQVIQKLKARNLPDSSIHTLKDTTVFTSELSSAIKRIQTKYNLTPDGILGFKTYKIINASPTDNIDQVKANLERQRWFTKPKKGPFVYINLPVYQVDMHWKDSMKSMKVCIGKNLPDNYDAMVKQYTDSGWLYKLPKNMETPQIASKISYVVVNPTWTVPYSIIKREMWWRLVNDPTYLERKGFKVYRGEEELASDTIQWSKINKNRIPYRIVENPGPKNSLGTVKYMFNNPFSIYLHDTPNKAAFKRTQRAVSHGCVRLEQPLLFGEFLMQNSKKYDSDDFRIMMGYPPLDPDRLEEYDPTDTLATVQKLEETTKIPLDTRMSLYLDYRTVYFDSDWKLHFAYDIYDENKLILEAMKRM